MADKAEQTEKGVDFKEKLKESADANRVIRYGERMKLEVIKDTKHYKKGQLIEPHTVMAEVLIANKIAKKATSKED